MYRSRYRRITFFFARLILSFAYWDVLLPRLGLRSLARRTRPERLRRSATAFRMLAIQMGGVMIKVGQFLSTRVDVLPEEVTSELAGLQDEVPPVDFPAIRQVAEADQGESLEAKYESFDPQPLAAASLGQVHRATLRPTTIAEPVEGWGQEAGVLDVVVKIQRPDIDQIIAIDLSALATVGKWLARYRPISRRADVPKLLAEFSRTLHEEIDYLSEGRNAETFAANFKGQAGVRVPRVVWPCTTQRVLTLENVLSIKINDYQAIIAAGIDRAEVASRLLDTYLQQIFEDGFFHADPHPGNLFVAPLSPSEGETVALPAWQLTFVDFGMVGRVPASLREALRELLIGVGTQDAARVVKSYQTMGVLLPGADLELLERAEATVFDRYWGKSMSELTHIDPHEVTELMGEFRELVFNMPFQIPQNLIFLARAVAILSGMCTGLDPEFNVWDHLAPYARKLIAQEARPTSQAILDEAASLFRSVITIPRKMDVMLSRMERGEIAVRAPEVSRQIRHMERAIRQVAGGVIFAALLLGGIQLHLANDAIFSDILLAGAGISLIWTILSGRRRF